MNAPLVSLGLLGDTVARDYSQKLHDFNAFAEPELRRLIGSLRLRAGMRILDAGCGTGETLNWLLEEVGPHGKVVGIDISAPHVEAARSGTDARIEVFQGNLMHAPFAPRSFDLIWCVNTLHHLRDPVEGARALCHLLRPGGRLAAGQSSLVPDMYFAWDARLERLTNEAVRHYYRERYGLDERSIAAVRALVGVLRHSGLADVRARTVMIERVSPLSATAETYLVQTLFRNTWGERLRPYLSPGDYALLMRTCDPTDAQFALRRADFHFLQSFTLCVGATQ